MVPKNIAKINKIIFDIFILNFSRNFLLISSQKSTIKKIKTAGITNFNIKQIYLGLLSLTYTDTPRVFMSTSNFLCNGGNAL